MNSKERVHSALRRQPTDRVPIFMWFHPETAELLGDLLEILPDWVGVAMGDDIRQTWVGNNYAMEGVVHERDGEKHMDFWAVEWVKYGPFNQIVHHPLKGRNRSELFDYPFPYHRIEALLQNMAPVIAAADEFFVGCDVSPCVFEMVCRLCGMQDALVNLVADLEVSNHLLKQSAAFSVSLAKAACEQFDLDWLWTGDDVGGQQAMLMSPTCWRDTIGPHLAEIISIGKSRNLWVAFHSCGAIRPIIPDLVEMGLDVLNPIQCNCPGMNPLELKQEFGKDLAFMGGVDTQVLLPHGTAEEVYCETCRLLEGMTTDGGGYILAASHTIPPETPVDNIFALYRAAGVSREEIFDRAADLRGQHTESAM